MQEEKDAADMVGRSRKCGDVCAFREPLLLREIKHRSTSAIQSPWTFSPAANSQQFNPEQNLSRISFSIWERFIGRRTG